MSYIPRDSSEITSLLKPATTPPAMKLSRLLLTPAAFAALVFSALSPTPLQAAPPIDLNGDLIPDIWAMRYTFGSALAHGGYGW